MKFLQRLKEPSTWAGFAVLAGIVSANPLVPAALVKIGAAVGAVLAVVLPENPAA